MNCKKGDIAVFVKEKHPEFESNIGRRVAVVDTYRPSSSGQARWLTVALQPILGMSMETGKLEMRQAGTVGIALDECLKPVPGDETDDRDVLVKELETC